METENMTPASETIQEFAERHGLIMAVDEIGPRSPRAPLAPRRFQAGFVCVRVKNKGYEATVPCPLGRGTTPDEAIADYAERMSGKVLFWDIFTTKKMAQAPVLTYSPAGVSLFGSAFREVTETALDSQSTSTLRELAKRHGLNLWVREEETKPLEPRRFLASLAGVATKDSETDVFVAYDEGQGQTRDAAIADYAALISGKWLVITGRIKQKLVQVPIMADLLEPLPSPTLGSLNKRLHSHDDRIGALEENTSQAARLLSMAAEQIRSGYMNHSAILLTQAAEKLAGPDGIPDKEI